MLVGWLNIMILQAVLETYLDGVFGFWDRLIVSPFWTYWTPLLMVVTTSSLVNEDGL